MRTHASRPVAGLTTSLGLSLALTLALSGCASDPEESAASPDAGSASSSDSPGASPSDSPPAASEEASAAADWLAAQLEDGLITSGYEDPPGSGEWQYFPDYGLTLDAFFAFHAVPGHEEEQAAVLDAIEADPSAYVGAGKTAYAGAYGKLLTAVEQGGEDAASYAGGGLLERLERLVRAGKGDEAGRAKDAFDPADEYGGDFSNTIGQSWVVRALAGEGRPSAAPSATFLLKQQCEEGYFRLSMESRDHTCEGGKGEERAASVDATAFAVLALRDLVDAGSPDEVADLSGAAEDSMAEAVAWLLDNQQPDGSFLDAEGGAANANSTGVAAEALRVAGEAEAAQRAASWLAQQQAQDSSPAALAEEAGAVAYDQATLEAAESKGKGITKATRYEWTRATAQAVGGLVGLS